MSLNNKGAFLYEAIISLMIVSLVFTQLISASIMLTRARIEAKEDFLMRQILISQLLLYENGREVSSTEDYTIYFIDQLICISYQSRTNKNKEYCLRYE